MQCIILYLTLVLSFVFDTDRSSLFAALYASYLNRLISVRSATLLDHLNNEILLQ